MTQLKYEIPNQHFFRIHHVRPRFKNDVENVLIYIASEIAKIPTLTKENFCSKLEAAIRLFPGNGSVTAKTIANWRTEIAALFGFIEHSNGLYKPGNIAELLAKNQDLLEFFRYFLNKFQYPGGHLKSKSSLEMLQVEIKFKPATYILNLIIEAQKSLNITKFGVSKSEICHCVFNDLRSTTGSRSYLDTVNLILNNRKNKLVYDESGDVVRYAGDILDYMELAGLLKREIYNGRYYIAAALKTEVLLAFTSDKSFFPEYSSLYGRKNLTLADVNLTNEKWFSYVNKTLNPGVFEGDVSEILNDMTDEEEQESGLLKDLIKKINQDLLNKSEVTTKKIGFVGESISIEHEKSRLRSINKEEFIKNVKKIPDHLGVGYDIQAHQGSLPMKKYIEVKTTISKGKINHFSFHMTPNEWDAAQTLKDSYYVYRLLISSDGIRLFQIHDPVSKYKNDLLDMSPRGGADIKYTEKSGTWEKLLV